MSRNPSHEEWAAARRRWEGDPRTGFGWLSAEMCSAFGVTISRQGVAKAAAKGDWTKGGEPSEPLKMFHGEPDRKDSEAGPVAGEVERVVAEPVDLVPGAKPVGYLGLGRPSKYRPEYAEMLVAFFSVDPFQRVEVGGRDGGATRIELVPGRFPMIQRFAASIHVSTDSVTAWATSVGADGEPRHPEFADAYGRARQLQEALLAEGALAGAFDQRFAQFAMKNLAGWRDQPAPASDFTAVDIREVELQYITVMEAAHERMREVLAERAHLFGDDEDRRRESLYAPVSH